MTAPDLRITGRLLAGHTELVAPFDLTLPAGRWSVVLGASGVGKTSLLRLIAGLPCPARLEGEIVQGDGTRPDPQGVAMMAQDDQLLPWAGALENVTIGARLRGQTAQTARAQDLLKQVGLGGLAERKPAQMSAGQRQRVALARTLFEDRDTVLLDEPFSALDVVTRHRMQNLAVRLFAGRRVVLITHDPGEAVRLAHAAWIMTRHGTVQVSLPPGPIPRAPDHPATLNAQAQVLREMSTLPEQAAQ
jgi:putative hydroxymethylpyrimidine transport system ATP-binding protein